MSYTTSLYTGSVYVFYASKKALWSERQRLLPPAPAADDYFGGSVSVYGAGIIVGAYGHDNARGSDAGGVHAPASVIIDILLSIFMLLM
jgi:hypothetical protein